MEAKQRSAPLLLISLAVLFASSIWFSGTAAAPALAQAWQLTPGQSANLTTAVQLGFITGTLIYAITSLADRFNARWVFFISAALGALANLGFAWSSGLVAASALRFITGLTLAGVYPVGMRIVASHFESGLGWRLGVMVGALTLGTASPYLLLALSTSAGWSFDWRAPVLLSSALATLGGLVMLTAVKDGPHLRSSAAFDPRMVFKVFQHGPYRSAALGYFGHMWELYAYWSMVRYFLGAHLQTQGQSTDSLPFWAFAIVGVGALGCAGGGWFSRRWGEVKVASLSLFVSGGMCLASPLLFTAPTPLLLASLLVWGIFVVSDSPQFSALAAKHCPPDYVGTALTVQNGVGFAITIFSIELCAKLGATIGWRYAFVVLALGPLVGLVALRSGLRVSPAIANKSA